MSETNDDEFYSQYVGNEAQAQPARYTPDSEPAEPSFDPEGTTIMGRDQHAQLMKDVGAYQAENTAAVPPAPTGPADPPTTIGGFPAVPPAGPGRPGADGGRHTLPPQAPDPRSMPPGRVAFDNTGQFAQPPAQPWTGQRPAFQEPFRSQGDRVRRAGDIEDDPYASVGPTRAEIRESQVVSPYKLVPQTGWRSGLYKVTRINLGLSANETHWNDLKRRLKVNLRGRYVIAVMQSKGGVNKTTTAAILGAVLAQYRDEKIVAIDANPADGNLAERVDQPSTESWRGLNADGNLLNYSDFRNYLGKDSHSGLEVLGGDPGRNPMTGADLSEAWSRLQKLYPIAIVDCGNQHRDDLTHALLEFLPVDAIVVPSTTRLDGAKAASRTLNWLMENGYPHLVREAVVIVSNINKVNASAQVKQLHKDFERTVRSVHDVDFDPHLSDAVPIDIDRLQPETWQAYVEAAASLADGFSRADSRSDRVPNASQQQWNAPLVPPQGGPGWPQQGQPPRQWQGPNHNREGGQWPAGGPWPAGGQSR